MQQLLIDVVDCTGNRHYGSTKLNVGSSRSHTIFRMEISQRDAMSSAVRVSELVRPCL
jgi:hypothetical protein